MWYTYTNNNKMKSRAFYTAPRFSTKEVLNPDRKEKLYRHTAEDLSGNLNVANHKGILLQLSEVLLLPTFNFLILVKSPFFGQIYLWLQLKRVWKR